MTKLFEHQQAERDRILEEHQAEVERVRNITKYWEQVVIPQRIDLSKSIFLWRTRYVLH
jgi:hypothetical protein